MSRSKKLKGGLNPIGYDQATPEIINAVKAVIAKAQKHRYSVKAIYDTHNRVFQTNAKYDNCSSCLKSRAEALENWLSKMPVKKEGGESTPESTGNGANSDDTDPGKGNPKGEGETGKLSVNLTPDYLDPTAPGYVEPAQGITRIPLADGTVLDFQNHDVEDGAKGEVKYADGGNVKPGKYPTADGNLVTVQPGGKGTFKVVEDLS